VPDLDTIDDDIVNGTWTPGADGARPLALFNAPRVDYSLARLAHYTATDPRHFQNFVLFTNYQFYVTEFEAFARRALADPESGYTEFVSTGNARLTDPEGVLETPDRLPQMPAYHLKRPDCGGITLVNIGVGPSNAKTATDHIAVLRPHAWVMVGHCAGLRNSQRLGDFVLGHAYLREDRVLDADLPAWVPIPALAEIQIALQEAVAAETALEGFDLKRVMRTGTVASVDNRNWELREQSGPVQRLSQSRAVALDMESAVARRRPRHGKRDDRRQRVPLPGALRHAAVRLGQAAAGRAQAAGHGLGFLSQPGLAAPHDRRAGDGIAAADAAGAHSQPQTALFRGDRVPLNGSKPAQIRGNSANGAPISCVFPHHGV